MYGKFIALPLIIALALIAPVSASTAKITAGAPVFPGETNLDISAALNGCHTISWWEEGANTTAPPQKSITIYEINTVTDKIYHFNISRQDFSGYDGSWYCTDKKPYRVVFSLLEPPQLDIRVWDSDHNEDVSGSTVPLSANITYRVDTNLYSALLVSNRPFITPADSFFTVTLTNPSGKAVSTIYTGNAGNPSTQILSFDKQPFISVSPYFWKNGKDWDRSARSSFGEALYPPGTYTFTITQDLNGMRESYRQAGLNLTGTITKSASVTFVRDQETPATPPSVTATATTGGPRTPPTVTARTPTSRPTTKPTYTPMEVWPGIAGIIIAGLILLKRT